MLTNVDPTQAETSSRRGPGGVSCIVACLFLVACRKSEQESAAGQTAPRATDAGVAPSDAALRRADAADWVEPARWRFDTIADLYQRDCPDTIPLTSTSDPIKDYRYNDVDVRRCTRRLGGVRGKTRKLVRVLLAQEDESSPWVACQAGSACWLSTVQVEYRRMDGTQPAECARIGSDLAEYGEAMLALTNDEMLKIAATVQREVDSKARRWIRVRVHDQDVILAGRQEAWPDGESSCTAAIHSGTVLHESEIVDVPLLDLPATAGGDGR